MYYISHIYCISVILSHIYCLYYKNKDSLMRLNPIYCTGMAPELGLIDKCNLLEIQYIISSFYSFQPSLVCNSSYGKYNNIGNHTFL